MKRGFFLSAATRPNGGETFRFTPHLRRSVAMQELALSARAHHKITRVARTIADLEGSQNIAAAHLSEAVQYRNLDRQMWMSGTKDTNRPMTRKRWWTPLPLGNRM